MKDEVGTVLYTYNFIIPENILVLLVYFPNLLDLY